MIKKRLHIWHILETYPPNYGGGAAITTRDVCQALVSRGHDVRVLCIEQTAAEPYSTRYDDDGGVRVVRINLPFVANDPDGWLFSKTEWEAHGRRIDALIEKLFGEWSPDIVDYHTARPLGEEVFVSVVQRGIPMIATLHESWLICLRLVLLKSPTGALCSGPGIWKCAGCMYSHYTDQNTALALVKLPWRLLKLGVSPAWRYKQRLAARRTLQGAIARSEFIAEKHRPHVGGPVIHIPLGLSLTGLPAERPLRPRNPLRFGFVGGFQPIKGIWHVLDAASILKREGETFELHIWGPGDECGLQEITARGLIDCVFYHGMYRPDDSWNVYAEMDIALMATTTYEALGRVPLEAAAMGAPTIAPAIGGIKETIRDGIDGLHYRFRDPEDLTRQMRRILKEKGLLEKLISNLQPPLDTSVQAAEVERFYYRVLGRENAEDAENMEVTE